MGTVKTRLMFLLSRNTKRNYLVEKANNLLNKALLEVLGLSVSRNSRYSSKCVPEIYTAQYENAMLVYIRGTPIWRPENSEIMIFFFNKLDRSLVSRNSITLKFNLLWFPNEARY